MRFTIWNSAIAALLFGTQAVRADRCVVPGGTSASPTDLAQYVSRAGCDEFVLQDGWYSFPKLTRPAITIRAEHAGKARVQNAFAIGAPGVTIDGVSMEGERRRIAVHAPGATIKNCRFSNFGKVSYGNAVWIRDESLSATNITVVANNTFDDWGGAPASACVVIGTTQDAPHVMEQISVHVLSNRFVRGPTAAQKPQGGNSAIQAFNPFLAVGNYIDTVNGPAIQNKTKNSKIIGNTLVNCTGWGALYNRAFGGNQWLSNVVMRADCGFDVFQGDRILFQGNVFYDVKYFGNIKNFRSGTHDLVFRNNTFCKSSGWAGVIWDRNSGGTFSGIVWRDNVFCETRGRAISWQGDYDKTIWDEDGNVFWRSQRPAQPTTGSAGSSVEMDPKFAGLPDNFTITNPALAGKGAKWPPGH
ncbi:MAG: hypothetical protein N2689_12355 [Verrucomicrobiae bacterium]|nr:hypothetical protein [Verrucomicrobiae bacterium]